MDENQYPFNKFRYINIPYPFYCIKPIISNVKKGTGKYSGRFAFILKPTMFWSRDTYSRTIRRNYLIQCTMNEIISHLYSKTGKRINRDDILKDVGKIVGCGVKIYKDTLRSKFIISENSHRRW